METYTYVARDMMTQKKLKGELKAENPQVIYEILVNKRLYPEQIRCKSKRHLIYRVNEKLRLTEVYFFCRQFSALYGAGMTISKILEICQSQTQYTAFKKPLGKIYDGINSGQALSESMRQTKSFPNLLVQLIKCGEATGTLGKVMEHASVYYGQQLTIRKKLKRALTYPTFVGVLILAVVGIFMVYVLPAYLSLLEDTGAAIPLPTQMLIHLSVFLADYGKACLVGIGCLYVCFRRLKKINFFRVCLEKICLKIPIVGRIKKQSLAADFSSTMALLVCAGLPIIQALEMTKPVMDYKCAQYEIEQTVLALKQGKGLYDALSKSQLYPEILMTMIGIGEESGTLEDMLTQMGQYFREEVTYHIEQLILWIEPIMTLIIGLIIGGLMAAVILPTFSAAMASM